MGIVGAGIGNFVNALEEIIFIQKWCSFVIFVLEIRV